jgi:hypothetical protein
MLQFCFVFFKARFRVRLRLILIKKKGGSRVSYFECPQPNLLNREKRERIVFKLKLNEMKWIEN